jgi:hypothetical protein
VLVISTVSFAEGKNQTYDFFITSLSNSFASATKSSNNSQSIVPFIVYFVAKFTKNEVN